MKTNGQVTIFFIVGIVVVFGIIAFFFIFDNDVIGTGDRSRNLGELVERCVEYKAAESLILLGLNGGDIYQQHNRNFGEYNVGYLFYNGESSLESLSDMSNNFGKFFEDELGICVKNISNFENVNYDIDIKKLKSRILLDKTVIFNVDYSVLAINEERGDLFEDTYRYEIPVNFTKYYSATKNILYMYEELDGNIDFVYLLEQDLNITMYQEDNSLFFILEDTKSLIDDEVPYPFIFALEVENETTI